MTMDYNIEVDPDINPDDYGTAPISDDYGDDDTDDTDGFTDDPDDD